MASNTPQQQIKELLEQLLPVNAVNVFGSQIIIEARSEKTARRAFRVLQKFCSQVHQPKKSRSYNKNNQGTNLCPSTYTVWLVGATI